MDAYSEGMAHFAVDGDDSESCADGPLYDTGAASNPGDIASYAAGRNPVDAVSPPFWASRMGEVYEVATAKYVWKNLVRNVKYAWGQVLREPTKAYGNQWAIVLATLFIAYLIIHKLRHRHRHSGSHYPAIPMYVANQ